MVTGYGTTKKRDLVTAVSSVSAEQIKDVPVANAAEALQGKLAGVAVTTAEGSPDADVKIRALDMYLGTQGSMPPADVAVRLAKALNVTVEYLVTGVKNNTHQKPGASLLEQNLAKVSPNTRQFLETAINLFAAHENP